MHICVPKAPCQARHFEVNPDERILHLVVRPARIPSVLQPAEANSQKMYIKH